MSAEYICERCGNDFARRDSLAWHRRWKYGCGEDEECDTARRGERWKANYYYNDSTVVKKVLLLSNSNDDNPTFDGAELCGDTPLTRQTLNKMLKC